MACKPQPLKMALGESSIDEQNSSRLEAALRGSAVPSTDSTRSLPLVLVLVLSVPVVGLLPVQQRERPHPGHLVKSPRLLQDDVGHPLQT